MPKFVADATRRVSDMVREWLPQQRYRMSREEIELAGHLRGNEILLKALVGLIQQRISGRAKFQEPSDPMECKALLARDGELRWFVSRLEFICRSPVNPPGRDAEQPEI